MNVNTIVFDLSKRLADVDNRQDVEDILHEALDDLIFVTAPIDRARHELSDASIKIRSLISDLENLDDDIDRAIAHLDDVEEFV